MNPSTIDDVPLELGVFAETFRRARVEETFDAMARHGFTCTQWDWAAVPGLESLPFAVPREVARRVGRAAAGSGVRVAAVSMPFNLVRRADVERAIAQLPAFADAAQAIGCDLLTLCTGSRHPSDPRLPHPANDSAEAWADMIDGLRTLSRLAWRAGVRLAIEPSTSCVVATATRAQRALRELGTDGDQIWIVVDAANLYRFPIDPRRHPGFIDDALVRLAPLVAVAHAGDIACPDSSMDTGFPGCDSYVPVAAGTGILPYAVYLAALVREAPRGTAARDSDRVPLILEGLQEDEVGAAVAFLKARIAALPAGLRRVQHPADAGGAVAGGGGTGTSCIGLTYHDRAAVGAMARSHGEHR